MGYLSPHMEAPAEPPAARWRLAVVQSDRPPLVRPPRQARTITLANSAGGTPLRGRSWREGRWSFCTNDKSGSVVALDHQRRALVVMEQRPADSPAPHAGLAMDAMSAVRLITRAYLEKSGAVLMHGVGLSVAGRGLLLMGDKGSGKTTMQLELLGGHRFVSSDRTYIRRAGG